MPAVIPFIPLIASVGTSVAGGLIGSHAAGKAASQQASAEEAALELATKAGEEAKSGIQPAVDRALAQTEPYTEAGSTALKQLLNVLNSGAFTDKFAFNPSDLEQDPGYQWTLNQGLQALQRSQAARGQLGGGASQKAIEQYAQGLAQTTYQQAFERALGTYNTNRQTALSRAAGFQNLAGMGASMASDNAGRIIQAQEYASDIPLRVAGLQTEAITGKGNAEAAGTVGKANVWSSALSGASNALQQFQLLNALKRIAAGMRGGVSSIRTPPFVSPDSEFQFAGA